MASNPTFRFEGEEEPVIPSKKTVVSPVVHQKDLQQRARELQQELGNPEDLLQAHLTRMSIQKPEVKEASAVDRLQRDGIYPCKEFVPSANLPKPNEQQQLLVKKLAALYFQVREHEVTLVQPISEVLEKGEKVFFSGMFIRPAQFGLTGALEVLDDKHDLLFPQKPENLYRIQLRNGRQFWMSHSSVDPLVPMGHSVFTKKAQEAFDPHEYRPKRLPFQPQPGFQELVGRNTELSAFAQHVITEARQQFGKNIELSIVQAGVPGQSGPILQVRSLHDTHPPVYVSAQQLAAQEVSPELFQTLMKIQKSAENPSTPETASEGIRGKIKKVLGELFGNS